MQSLAQEMMGRAGLKRQALPGLVPRFAVHGSLLVIKQNGGGDA
jgi:hypothetical protein